MAAPFATAAQMFGAPTMSRSHLNVTPPLKLQLDNSAQHQMKTFEK
jgi:hypothetical protein